MKFVIKTFFLLLISNSVFATDILMKSSEFLKKLDAKQLIVEKYPLIPNVPPQYIEQFKQSQKKAYPNFKDEMVYTGTVTSRDYVYGIFYEWYNRGCVFYVRFSREMKPITEKYNKSKSESEKEALNKQAYEIAMKEASLMEKIDSSYCEKILGITLPASKGLFKLPNIMNNE